MAKAPSKERKVEAPLEVATIFNFANPEGNKNVKSWEKSPLTCRLMHFLRATSPSKSLAKSVELRVGPNSGPS